MRSSWPSERSSVKVQTPSAVPIVPPLNSTAASIGSMARRRQ